MVNIDTVYQRVLLLANKEQRGYITPDEFNSFAEQAQLEIFEAYLIKKAQASAIPGTTDEYGDIAKIAEERLTYFDNTLNALTTSTLAGSTVGFAYPDNFWSLGVVLHGGRVADEVSHRDLSYIQQSPLTSPTTKQPVYTRHENGIVVRPSTIENIDITYLRRPNDPLWSSLADPMGEPVYNQAASIDFELNPAEEPQLVYRILTLSGVAIKQQDIAGFGQSNKT